jgi:hypothetical protein
MGEARCPPAVTGKGLQADKGRQRSETCLDFDCL